MNEQKPYEKHLASKLDSLSPKSDAAQNWPQMKSMLDREMPDTGGAGRWWMYGIIAGILITASWFAFDNFSGNKEPMAVQTNESSSNNATDNPNTNSTTIDSKSTLNSLSESQTSAAAEKNNVSKSQEKNDVGSIAVIPAASNKKTNGASEELAEKQTSGNNTIGDKNPENFVALPVVANNEGSVSKKEKKHTPRKEQTGDAIIREVNPLTNSRKKATQNKTESPVVKVAPELLTGEFSDESADASLVSFDINSNVPAINTSFLITDSINKNYPAMEVAERSRFKVKSDRVKALKNRSVGTGEEKNFVLALSLPLAFPLSDQRVVAYNFNARANTVTDYLPAPTVQYHLNQRSFLQAELQIGSPQYIQPVLLAQRRYELSSTSNYRFVTSSVYARKLYYFNLPLMAHYSPFKNFYLGSGVQFSSLMSGVGMSEDRGYNSLQPSARDSLFTQSYFKFKNDTLSGRLNNNEFRVLLDANYYWKKFTVGLRYNQALSNYVNIQINNNTPVFTDKNKSMQFYLRYNLWEDKKRKPSLAKK